MPISPEDVKLMASQRLADTTDGGGRMTGNEIVDGNVNNLFPDISRLDRVYGRVSLRKAFVAVHTQDSDAYSGAHVILSVPARDPNVSVCIFSTQDPHDVRDGAKDRLESYVTRGPRYHGWLWGPQLAGSRALLIFQPKGSALPEVGEVLYLIQNEGLATEKSQYVRITKVEATEQTFTALTQYSSTSYQRMVVQVEIGDPLRDTYPGIQMSNNDALATNINTTVVSDAAKYYGVMSPTQAIAPGDIAIRVDSIYTHLVPSAQAEAPVVDLRIGESGPVMGSGQNYTVNVASQAWTNGSQLHFCRGIKMGSLTITGGGKTFTDDGNGILMEGATERGTVDYSTGAVTFTSIASFTAALTATAVIGAALTRVPNTTLIPVALSNRGYNYTALLDPQPVPRTLTVDFMAQGKWYRLRDNGKGSILPDIDGTGSGSVNYTTGSVVLTCGALPDVDTAIMFTWGAPIESQDISGTITIPVAEISHTIAEPPIKPGSLVITWPSGSGTATATSDSAGVISGDAVGLVNHATGTMVFKPTSVPASGGVYTIDYEKYPHVIGSLDGGGGSTYNVIIPGAPLQPRTVKLALHLLVAGHARVHEFTDNGDGTISAPAWTLEFPVGKPAEWPGTTNFQAMHGTIDYITGAVQINLVGTIGTRTWREPYLSNIRAF